MRIIFFFTALYLLITTSCYTQETIKGNGNVITKTHEVNAFSKLKVACNCNVELIQSGNEQVIIEADENLQELFEIENEGDQLTVKNIENLNFKSAHKCMVYIHSPNINTLNISNVGNVTCNNPLDIDKLYIINSSVGSVNLNLTLNELELKNSGVGNLSIIGKANIANVKNSGVGNVKMEDFNAKIINVKNSSVGNVHVYASDEISINHSGVGNLIYSGNPDVKDLHVSAVGKVKKR